MEKRQSMFKSFLLGLAPRCLLMALLGPLLFPGQANCAVAAPTPQATATAPARESGRLTVLTRATAQQATTADLAKHLLHPTESVRITDHELDTPPFRGGPLHAVTFFARPEPLGTDLCERDTFYVEMEPVGGAGFKDPRVDVSVTRRRVTEKKQIALTEGFGMQPNTVFASLNNVPLEDAVSALRNLAGFQRAARAGEVIPVVTCAANAVGNSCRNPRADLARLPLNRIFAIRRFPLTVTGYPSLDFLVMPDGQGRAYWEVRIEEQSGKSAAVELDWTMPPPF